mgnify:CR=1 FL=1
MIQTMAKSVYETKIEPRLEEVKQWRIDGHTDKQIYEALGINADTFYKYKKIKLEFFEALKETKDIADNQVHDSLWKRANGYDVTETKTTYGPDGSIIKIEETKKHIPPDPTSMIFWLKNRRPKEWRDKQEIEHSGEVEQTVIVLPTNSRLMNDTKEE